MDLENATKYGGDLFVEKDGFVYSGSLLKERVSHEITLAFNRTVANHLLAELGLKAFDK